MSRILNRLRRIYPARRRPPRLNVGAAEPNLDIYIPVGIDVAGTLVYLPLCQGGTIPTTSIAEGWVQYIAPCDLTIVEVVLFNISTNYGSTIIGTHIDGNTTPIDTDTQTLNTDSGNVVFTLGTSVLKGERISISFDGQFSGGEVTGYIRLTPV